jgi:hypothetical protein
MLRISGDTIELTPPLILSEKQIDEIMEKTAARRSKRRRRICAALPPDKCDP